MLNLDRWIVPLLVCGIVLPPAPVEADNRQKAASIIETINNVEEKVVKIHGAGGYQHLETYQSGFLISPQGHILTVWSYVLDTEYVTAVLSDGRKLQAELLGADPRLEVAVLKVDAVGLPCFDLNRAVELESGTRVLAFSNMFGVAIGSEPSTVQHGVVSVKTRLQARSKAYKTPYDGPVYVLDCATNNPGAAGGCLSTRAGELAAMLGKELQNAQNNTWLNYAIPIGEISGSVDRILSGESIVRSEEPQNKPDRGLTARLLGIVLVPDVVQRTPPYLDQVRPASPAASAGLRADDLLVMVDDHLIQSCKELLAELEYVDHEDPVRLTVLREQQLLEFVLTTQY